jgi:hypothetical protein
MSTSVMLGFGAATSSVRRVGCARQVEAVASTMEDVVENFILILCCGRVLDGMSVELIL